MSRRFLHCGSARLRSRTDRSYSSCSRERQLACCHVGCAERAADFVGAGLALPPARLEREKGFPGHA